MKEITKQEDKNEITLLKNQAIIFFNKDNFIICDGSGVKDKFFIGDLILYNTKVFIEDFLYKRDFLNFCFLSGFNKNYNENISIENKCFLLGENQLDNSIDFSKSLILYNFSKEIIINYVNKFHSKSIKYLTSVEIKLNLLDLESKFLSYISPFEDGIRNIDLIKELLSFKSGRFFFFKKNIVIFDFGYVSLKIIENLNRKHNVYVCNLHTSLQRVEDLNPSLVILSDGFCNPNIAYFQFINKLEFLMSINISVLGVGIGMYIINRRLKLKIKEDLSKISLTSHSYLYDTVRNLRIKNSILLKKECAVLSDSFSKEDKNIKYYFKSLEGDLVFGFRIVNKKNISIYCFAEYHLLSLYLRSNIIL